MAPSLLQLFSSLIDRHSFMSYVHHFILRLLSHSFLIVWMVLLKLLAVFCYVALR
jgi:hypothetical protein